MTILALAAASPAAHAAYGQRTLQPGSTGRDVSALQGYLDTSGYQLSTTGRFDRPTAQAVRRYERDMGLKVDGVVDRDQATRIRRFAEAPPATGGSTPIGPIDIGSIDPSSIPTVPGERARLRADGTAEAPRSAPESVKLIIAAGNQIARMPYRYGGGHGRWIDSGYDCSGSVSFALHGAGLLRASAPSTGFYGYGIPGPGRWVTVYTNPGHMYMVVAGLRFDTSGARQTGSRWQTAMRPAAGYMARHPAGL